MAAIMPPKKLKNTEHHMKKAKPAEVEFVPVVEKSSYFLYNETKQ